MTIRLLGDCWYDFPVVPGKEAEARAVAEAARAEWASEKNTPLIQHIQQRLINAGYLFTN